MDKCATRENMDTFFNSAAAKIRGITEEEITSIVKLLVNIKQSTKYTYPSIFHVPQEMIMEINNAKCLFGKGMFIADCKTRKLNKKMKNNMCTHAKEVKNLPNSVRSKNRRKRNKKKLIASMVNEKHDKAEVSTMFERIEKINCPFKIQYMHIIYKMCNLFGKKTFEELKSKRKLHGFDKLNNGIEFRETLKMENIQYDIIVDMSYVSNLLKHNFEQDLTVSEWLEEMKCHYRTFIENKKEINKTTLLSCVLSTYFVFEKDDIKFKMPHKFSNIEHCVMHINLKHEPKLEVMDIFDIDSLFSSLDKVIHCLAPPSYIHKSECAEIAKKCWKYMSFKQRKEILNPIRSLSTTISFEYMGFLKFAFDWDEEKLKKVLEYKYTEITVDCTSLINILAKDDEQGIFLENYTILKLVLPIPDINSKDSEFNFLHKQSILYGWMFLRKAFLDSVCIYFCGLVVNEISNLRGDQLLASTTLNPNSKTAKKKRKKKKTKKNNKIVCKKIIDNKITAKKENVEKKPSVPKTSVVKTSVKIQRSRQLGNVGIDLSNSVALELVERILSCKTCGTSERFPTPNFHGARPATYSALPCQHLIICEICYNTIKKNKKTFLCPHCGEVADDYEYNPVSLQWCEYDEVKKQICMNEETRNILHSI